MRVALAKFGIKVVIPCKSNRLKHIPHNKRLYKMRNQIERLFNRLKNWRRLATRYDKSAASFLSFLQIVSAKFWASFVNAS
jgi:transposase